MKRKNANGPQSDSAEPAPHHLVAILALVTEMTRQVNLHGAKVASELSKGFLAEKQPEESVQP